jgi:hypothetical protein
VPDRGGKDDSDKEGHIRLKKEGTNLNSKCGGRCDPEKDITLEGSHDLEKDITLEGSHDLEKDITLEGSHDPEKEATALASRLKNPQPTAAE